MVAFIQQRNSSLGCAKNINKTQNALKGNQIIKPEYAFNMMVLLRVSNKINNINVP